MTVDGTDNRRIRRTRMAVFNAFRTLVLTRRYDDIRVADIIAEADIGKSTFYEHFNSKDDVLLFSIEPLFTILADMTNGNAKTDDVSFVYMHFWEQRAFGRVLFSSDLYFKLVGKLADMIGQTRANSARDMPPRLYAVENASAILGVLRAWFQGEFSCEAKALAVYMREQFLRSDPF